MVIAEPPRPATTPEEARAALAAAWASRAPSTAEAVNAFYRECPGELMADDLAHFHSFPERQRWTGCIVHVAKTPGVERVVDIGCGAGHDLMALAEALPALDLYGVEPNEGLRSGLGQRFPVVDDAAYAPIETADLLVCIDVLEHIPEPETWLTSIATRAKVGAMLVEATATEDCGTPLHLPDNRGWHPGRALRRAGWELIDESGRLRVWRRFRAESMARTPIVLCANREISVKTFDSVLRLVETRTDEFDWRPGRAAESGLLRARSIWTSKWYREHCDDGFLMVDADIEFQPEDAEKIVRLGRETRSIAVAAYAVRDGAHLAIRALDPQAGLTFGPNLPPVEIRWGATGFMYVHRDVLDAMIPTLPLCHATQPWALWPMFDFQVVPDDLNGDLNWLSEDWTFTERARALGFKVWLDPTVTLTHWGAAPVTVRNLEAVHALHRGTLNIVRE